jgi:hypothetical protein
MLSSMGCPALARARSSSCSSDRTYSSGAVPLIIHRNVRSTFHRTTADRSSGQENRV